MECGKERRNYFLGVLPWGNTFSRQWGTLGEMIRKATQKCTKSETGSRQGNSSMEHFSSPARKCSRQNISRVELSFSELNWHHSAGLFLFQRRLSSCLSTWSTLKAPHQLTVRIQQKFAKLINRTSEHWPRIWPKHKLPYLRSYLSNLFVCLMFKGTQSNSEYIWEGLKNCYQVHSLLKINSQSIIQNQTFKDRPHNQVWTPKISM